MTTVTDSAGALVSTCQPADASTGEVSCLYESTGNTIVTQTDLSSVETAADGTTVETCTVPDAVDSSQYCYVTDGTGYIQDSSGVQTYTCAAADASTGNYACTDDADADSVTTYDSSQVFVSLAYTWWGMTMTTLADETSTTILVSDGSTIETCAAPDASDSSVTCANGDATETTITQTDGSSVTTLDSDGSTLVTCAATDVADGSQACTDAITSNVTTTETDGSSVTVDGSGTTVETCGAKADDGTQTCTTP